MRTTPYATNSVTFQSTLPLRGVTYDMSSSSALSRFQSTLPLRGVTAVLLALEGVVEISIHTPLAGSDFPYPYPIRKRKKFQSTLPLRGVTPPQLTTGGDVQFQSTLPLRGVTVCKSAKQARYRISIHTPLAGSDPIPHIPRDVAQFISIHTPLAGSDRSTRTCPRPLGNFNPHSPCGE